MPSGKLGSALLTANTDNRVYTVPAGKTSSTNVTFRNQTPFIAQVSMVATDATLSATEYSTTSSVTASGDWYTDTFHAGNYGYGVFNNEINSNLYRNNTSGNYTPRWVNPTDRTLLTGFTYTNPVTGDNAVEHPLTTGNNHNNMNASFQISGFYNDNDYWFAGSSRYLACPTSHPLSKPGWNSGDMSGSYTGSTRNYYTAGGIGFRNVYLSYDNSGYVTKTIGRSGFFNEDRTTNSDNSFYYLAGGSLGYSISTSNFNLSVLPTTRLGQGRDNQFYFVGMGHSSSTIGFGVHFYDRIVNSGGWGGSNNSYQVWAASWPSSSSGARWVRPVGNFVYGYSGNGRVYRRPITGWISNTTTWDDVTSVFGAAGTMVSNWAIVEDRNGIGYWFDTSGNLWHTNPAGDTWYKCDQTNRAFLLNTITTGLPASGVNFKYAPIGTFTEGAKSWMVMEQSVAGYRRNFCHMDQALATAPGDLLEFNTSLSPGAILSNTGLILNANSSVVVHSNINGVRAQVFGYEENT
jgi:hypothetical protein